MPPLAYQDIVDLMASAKPTGGVTFRPSEQARVEELIEQEKTQGLSGDERRELERCLQLEPKPPRLEPRSHHAG